MKRLERRGQLVLDEGDFYEIENSVSKYYIPFIGEAGQSNPVRVVLNHLGVGCTDYGEEGCDKYFAVFETLKEAQEFLSTRSEQASLEEVELCARCERRPPTKGDFCDRCAATLEGN
jgi:hypothetical protein